MSKQLEKLIVAYSHKTEEITASENHTVHLLTEREDIVAAMKPVLGVDSEGNAINKFEYGGCQFLITSRKTKDGHTSNFLRRSPQRKPKL
jgi:glycerol-3-phosphate cytidylyltransferase-like family protein